MLLMGGIFAFCLIFMAGRLGYLMIGQADKYLALAKDLHQREREIKAPRGNIYDRNGVKIASNKAVYSISVIHSQTKQKEKVVSVLSKELQIDESEIKKKVYKNSVREKIKSNVDKTQQTVSENMNLPALKWMRIINGLILIMIWLQKSWDLQEETIRGSLGLR